VIECVKAVVSFRNTDVNQATKNAILKLLEKQEQRGNALSKLLLHLLNWWWGPPLKLLKEFGEGQVPSEKSSSFYIESRQESRQTSR